MNNSNPLDRITGVVKILGLTHPISLNSAACLIDEKKIYGFAEEERFNRVKHSPYYPPNKSVEFCLKQAKISLEEVDYVALGFDTFPNIFKANFVDKLKAFFTRIRVSDNLDTFHQGLSLPEKVTSEILYFLSTYYHGLFRLPLNYPNKKIKFIRHHTAHCASAYYVSGFSKACIISADGGGGQEAGVLAVAENDHIRIIRTIPNSSSLGNLYSTITRMLGFQDHDGEGKVMGLAAFGKKNAPMLPFVSFRDGIAHINQSKMFEYLSKIKPKLSKNPLSEFNASLAASLQRTVEEAYIYMATYLYNQTGIRNFCLTGGVSLNCLANTKVLNLGFVDDLYIQPASHDAGTALGAALQVFVNLNGKRPSFKFEHPYWGPEFSEQEILSTLKKAEVEYFIKVPEVTKTVAKLLADGYIIGWVQGKMEIGPRALGNRSILADPSKAQMKDLINKRIKGREPWRPFAPSILEEFASDYLLDCSSSPFMILESRLKKEKAKDLVAATHIDGTVRPQTISKKTNLKYWQLIDEFRKMRGIPALLNTSFNLSGEPMICSPEDALSTFFRTGLDYLVIGNYIISKKPFKSI